MGVLVQRRNVVVKYHPIAVPGDILGIFRWRGLVEGWTILWYLAAVVCLAK